MDTEFSNIVTELGQAVIPGFERAGLQNGLVEMGGGPCSKVTACSLHQQFQKAHQSRVLQFDSGHLGFALDHGFGQSSQDIKLAMDIEMLGLGLGKTVRDELEAFPNRGPIFERFFEAKILEIIGDDLLTQKGGSLFILFEEGVFVIGAEHLLAMVDSLDHILPLARDGFEQPLLAK